MIKFQIFHDKCQNSNDKINPKSKCQISKQEVLSFGICALGLFWILYFGICHLYAQDNNKLVALSKQIMEAKSNEELYPVFEELKDLYFFRPAIKSEGGIPPEAGKDNKYNEFVDFLHSLASQKNTLEPIVNYYIAFTRYSQLKHLEETQNWDEYFSQGNTYRDEITQSAQKAIESFSPQDTFSLYARLILWKFHRDQRDSLSDSALSDLIGSTLIYAKETTELEPLKRIADELLSYGEKAKAKQIYSVYLDRLSASDINDDELNMIALDFYKKGNLDFAQTVYEAYIERIEKNYPKEKLISTLIEIARLFSYRDERPSDTAYAERMFQKIEGLGGKDIFDEELIYLRAFNLEKSKQYIRAKDCYIELLQRYPNSVHSNEANFKIGIIYAYILKDIKSGKGYFEGLAQKEALSPQAISGLYHLGLLSQWEGDSLQAKEYYNNLLQKAKENFRETIALTKERLKEIEEAKPIEYNLKTFLEASFKEEYSAFDTPKADLEFSPYKARKDEEINISSTVQAPESGCMQVNLQYLWSGDLGAAKPTIEQPSFVTRYTDLGTKVINLVLVSPTGIIDRGIDMLDVN